MALLPRRVGHGERAEPDLAARSAGTQTVLSERLYKWLQVLTRVDRRVPTKGAAMHLTPVDHAVATGRTKELLDGVAAAFGKAPNMTLTMAVNPAVLEGWIELNAALEPTLSRQLNEQIAIAIAEANGCAYCLAAHTAVGRLVGVEESELALSRTGDSSDPRGAAALRFALAVNEKRGGVSDQDLAEVRAAGYDDPDIAAIVGHVALNVLTNYFNRVAHTELDFPVVEQGMAEAA